MNALTLSPRRVGLLMRHDLASQKKSLTIAALVIAGLTIGTYVITSAAGGSSVALESLFGNILVIDPETETGKHDAPYGKLCHRVHELCASVGTVHFHHTICYLPFESPNCRGIDSAFDQLAVANHHVSVVFAVFALALIAVHAKRGLESQVELFWKREAKHLFSGPVGLSLIHI